MRIFFVFTLCVLASIAVVAAAAADLKRFDEVYPDFADNIFAEAHLDALPEGEVMRADDIVITAAMLDEDLSALPDGMRDQARGYQFYLLENMAMEKLLMREVLGDADAELEPQAMQNEFRAYMLDAVGEVAVSDAEVETFFEENRAMLPDMPLEQMRAGIEGHLMQQKQEEAWNAHVQRLGGRISIALNEDWTAAQIKQLKDNPVDKARTEGKPVMANFGAESCPACRVLKPVMASLRERFADQAAIIEVNLNEQQFLANRFNVSGIPLLVFYDKDGREAYRHTGAMSEQDIVKQLQELGVS